MLADTTMPLRTPCTYDDAQTTTPGRVLFMYPSTQSHRAKQFFRTSSAIRQIFWAVHAGARICSVNTSKPLHATLVSRFAEKA
jgi:hypothetical protein